MSNQVRSPNDEARVSGGSSRTPHPAVVGRSGFDARTAAVLTVLLIAGAGLRFAGLDWDGGFGFHVDENNGVIAPARALGAADGFRPSFAAYGSLPLYLIRGTGEFAARLGFVEDGSNEKALRLIGRAISAAASTLSILLVYLIATRLFGRLAGLLGAAFCTFSVLLIQSAHFCTVEAMLTLWLLGALYAATLIVEEGSWKGYALFGLFTGLGLATKASAVSFFALLGAAYLIGAFSEEGAGLKAPFSALWRPWHHGRRSERAPWRWTAGAACLSAGLIVAVACLLDAGEKPWVRQHVVALVGAAAVGAAALLFVLSRPRLSRGMLLLGSVALAAVIFFVGWPWAILGFHDQPWAAEPIGVLASLRFESGIVSGANDVPWTECFHPTLPYAYTLEQVVRWGLGIPLGVVAVAGFGFAVWRASDAGSWRRWLLLAGWLAPFALVLVFRAANENPIAYAPLAGWVKAPSLALAFVVWVGALLAMRGEANTEGLLLILAWGFPYVLLIGSWKAKFIRYSVPLAPMLCIFAGAMLANLWQRLKSVPARVATAAATALVILFSAFYSFAFLSIYLRPNSRVVASNWIHQELPAGATVIREQWWNDGLPLPVLDFVAKRIEARLDAINHKHFGDPADGTLQIHRRELFEHGGRLVVDERKVDYLCDALQWGDCIIIANDRHYRSILAMPQRYPIAALYYKRLFTEQLGFRLVATIASPPRLLGLEFADDLAEEGLVNYDHPKIHIFRKVERLSAKTLWERLVHGGSEMQWVTQKDIMLKRARGTSPGS